jgi:hypothetical protein
MGKYRIAAVLFLLLLAIPRTGRAAGPDAGARQLVQTVDAALAGAAQAAQTPRQGLDPGNPKYAPFWNALQALRARVSRIEGSLPQAGSEFFLLVDQGSSDLGELRVAWARTGVKNDRVAEELRIASTSYRLLRSTYGREGLRQRQGGPLSEAERRQLLRLQRTERRLAASLQLLRDQARRRRDAVTAAELERFRAEAETLGQASADLASYLNALIAASEMRGEWQADAPYIRKAAPPAQWAAADETVQDLYVDSDIGQVFTVDLGKTGDPATAPGRDAVQLLQPGEEVTEAVVVEPLPASMGGDVEDVASEDTVEAGPASPAEREAVAEPAPAPETAEVSATGEEAEVPAADATPKPADVHQDQAQPRKEARKIEPPAAVPPPLPSPIG